MRGALIVAVPLLLLGAAGAVGYLAYRRSHPTSGAPKGIAVGEPAPSAVPQSLPDVLSSATPSGPATLASGEPWHTEPPIVADVSRAFATGAGGIPPNIQEIIYAAEKQRRLYLDLLGAQDMKAAGQPTINGELVDAAIARFTKEFSAAQDKYQALFAAAKANGYEFSFN